MAADRSYRQECIAAGWLAAVTGERTGIAHVGTVERGEGVNDTVFCTWEACWTEAVQPWER